MIKRYSWNSYALHPAANAYVSQDSVTDALITAGLNLKSISEIIKTNTYSTEKRGVLTSVLKSQVNHLQQVSPEVIANIELLKKPNAFTVSCGHQLVLWSGPLFVWTKIAHCIALCKQLQLQFPQHHFIPVFWLASEDHDVAEIQTVHVFDKRYHWPVAGKGSVGNLIPDSELNTCQLELQNAIQGMPFADACISALNEFKHSATLSQAIQGILYRFFGSEGLVCIDAQHADLKNLFKPILHADVLHGETLHACTQTMQYWQSMRWKPVIGFRDCNMFYLQKNSRKRIDKTSAGFALSDQSKTWTAQELEMELNACPELFSPNALLRTVYQQSILPNIIYVAGPQELAYWLQLKSVFKHYQVPYPLLSLRYMQIPLTAKIERNLQKLNVEATDLFKPEEAVLHELIQKHPLALDADYWSRTFKARIEDLGKSIYSVDASLKGAFEAETQKYLKAVERLISKSNAKIKTHAIQHTQYIHDIYNALYPQHHLLERSASPLQWYLTEGPDFVKQLIARCEQLEGEIVFYTTT